MGQSRRCASRHHSLLLLAAFACLTAQYAEAATFGGDVTAVSDYIFRGISQNYGDPAAQLDLHLGTANGFFVGAWGSTLNSQGPRPNFEVQLYGGKRFDLSTAWSATVQGVNYAYVGKGGAHADDYQELSVGFSYLDSLNFSVSAAPNAIRYWQGFRLGRYPAYGADATGQWSVGGNVFLTGGAGYYYLSGPSFPHSGTPGYPYGNVGFAVEERSWRLDVGYYFAEYKAELLFPYAQTNNRVAATLSWRF